MGYAKNCDQFQPINSQCENLLLSSIYKPPPKSTESVNRLMDTVLSVLRNVTLTTPPATQQACRSEFIKMHKIEQSTFNPEKIEGLSGMIDLNRKSEKQTGILKYNRIKDALLQAKETILAVNDKRYLIQQSRWGDFFAIKEDDFKRYVGKGDVTSWYVAKAYFLGNRDGQQHLLKHNSAFALSETQQLDASILRCSRFEKVDPTLKGIQRATLFGNPSEPDVPPHDQMKYLLQQRIQTIAEKDFSFIDKPSPAQYLKFMDQILSGAATIFKAGYVHLNLKPSRILLVGGEAKISGYGHASSEVFKITPTDYYPESLNELQLKNLIMCEYTLWKILDFQLFHKATDVPALAAIIVDMITTVENRQKQGIDAWSTTKLKNFDFLRREMPADLHPIVLLLEDMINLPPEKKPSMLESKERFERIFEQVKNNYGL